MTTRIAAKGPSMTIPHTCPVCEHPWDRQHFISVVYHVDFDAGDPGAEAWRIQCPADLSYALGVRVGRLLASPYRLWRRG